MIKLFMRDLLAQEDAASMVSPAAAPEDCRGRPLRAYPKTFSALASGRATTGFRPRRCATPTSLLSATPRAGARRAAWLGRVFTRQYSGGLAAATPPAAKPAGGGRWRPARQVSQQVLG